MIMKTIIIVRFDATKVQINYETTKSYTRNLKEKWGTQQNRGVLASASDFVDD